jgi:membrane protease YdiL (CAAX protease family)
MLSPDNWWAFILVTAAIAIALRLVVGGQWTLQAGLVMPPSHAGWAVIAFALIAAASQAMLGLMYSAAALKATAPALQGQIGFLFQALNEEIVFRALLIGLLAQFVRPALMLSVAAAFVFAAAHFLLYRYSNPLHVALAPAALASLFLAGVAMNNLYLGFRHVGFSWALHAGWNVVWLPAAFRDAMTGETLHEPQVFDRVLGSPAMVAMTAAVAVLSFALLARRQVA